MTRHDEYWAAVRRALIALTAQVVVLSLIVLARDLANAGDRGLGPQIVAGTSVFLGVWLWLFHQDAKS